MHKVPFLYRRPMFFAAAAMLAAIALIIAGFASVRKSGMDGYGLIVLGVFLGLVSIITALVYASLQRKFKSALGEPLLSFTAADLDHEKAVARTINQIKWKNRVALVTILIFCAVLAIIGPFIADDGYIFSLAALGIAVFAALAAFTVTRYRTSKLKSGSREVVLSRNGVYVAGEFHSWNGFTSKLIDIKFVPPATDENGEPAMISGSYKMLGAYRANIGFFNLAVPSELADQALEAVEKILDANRRASGNPPG